MGWFLLPYFLLLLHFPSYIGSLCNQHDYSALLQFKNSFALNTSSFDYWDMLPSSLFSSKTESWKNGTDCCEWDGVTCETMSGHVIGLDLSCSNLQGRFHPNSTLFKLRHLQQLNLAYNDFNGSLIYSGFGDLVNLTHLNLSHSFIGGEIPSTISHLSKLVSLDLHFSNSMRLDPFTWNKLIRNATRLRELHLNGVDMSSIKLSSLSLLMNYSSSLVTLNLAVTGLQGNLPRDIFCLPNLKELSLSYNENLRGELPKSNWSTPLTILDLSETAFSGEIPNSIGHLNSLNSLDLSGCHFSGPVPLSLWNLSQLTYLSLTFNNLNGEIPSLLSNLKHLTSFQLQGNNCSGHIPDVFGDFIKLEVLSLWGNNLIGLIPSSLFHLPQLSILDLSDNTLVGPIPSKITKLSKLNTLDLSYNMLNGTIPHWCYSLTSLLRLFLNDNKLTGSISEFSTYSLESLHLSHNNLQGNFPNSIFELENLTYLDLSSNDMSGLVDFHQFSKLKNLDVLDLSGNSFLSLNFASNMDYTLPNLERLYLSSCHINSFPQFLARLHNLQELDLSNNNIQGKIPKWFHEKLILSWRFIRYINLSSNQLQGDLPIPPNTTQYFLVSNNNFTGDISSTICNASSLFVLNLGHNNLTGMIPQCLGTFPSLSVLDLQMNSLHGNMPRSFSKGNAFETIKLNGNRLEGPLPRSLAHCTNLEVLDLAENSIEDIFPTWLETLQVLKVLSLRSNKFHGVITSFRAKHPFPTLKIFDVSNNNFSGPLPASYIKNFDGMMNVNDSQTGLEYMGNKRSYNDSIVVVMKGKYMELVRILITFTTIDLSNNMFDGDLPIPPIGTKIFSVSNNNFTGDISSTICNASSLVVLNLAHNNLTGMIPQCLGTFPSLSVLDLQMNNLHGNMPRSFSKGNAFETIKLNGNRLEGPLPRSLAHCKNLEVLDLAENSIEDIFPSWLETLQVLKVLSLRSNKFHGVITSFRAKHPFPMLKIFDVSNNNFSGPLPTSYIKNFDGMMNVNDSQTGLEYMGHMNSYNDSIVVVMKGQYMELVRILTTFTTIDLSNNMFEGEIPKVIGELNSLRGLNLSHNRITGTIPQSLSNLRDLEWLDLSSNQLRGEIPVALTNLNFLSFLNLSQNQFEGIIPTGRQFDTFGNDSYEGNPKLCGVPLSRSCNNDEKWSPHSTFHHEESGFGWKAVAVGYASGMVFGMVLGYNVFFNGKPQWLARLAEAVLNGRVTKANNRAPSNRRGRN